MSAPWDWTPAELAYLASAGRHERMTRPEPDGSPDEPPELPHGWDFDPAELEDFTPTAADMAWFDVHRLGVALRDLPIESIFESLAGLDGDRLVVLEAVIQEALGLRADAAAERYATTT